MRRLYPAGPSVANNQTTNHPIIEPDFCWTHWTFEIWRSATTTAPGADENDDDPDDKHEFVNTETDKNIESEKSHSYCIDEKCSKQLLDATNVGIKSIPNTRLKKQQTKNVKTD